MADVLHRKFPDAAIEMVKGEKGIFSVSIDDEVVFSKSERGIKLSEVSDDEIVQIIDEME